MFQRSHTYAHGYKQSWRTTDIYIYQLQPHSSPHSMLWALHILLVWPKTRGALLSLNKKGMIFPIITISSSLPGSWLAPRQPNIYFDRNAACMLLLYIYVLDVRMFVLRFNGNHGPNKKKTRVYIQQSSIKRTTNRLSKSNDTYLVCWDL